MDDQVMRYDQSEILAEYERAVKEVIDNFHRAAGSMIDNDWIANTYGEMSARNRKEVIYKAKKVRAAHLAAAGKRARRELLFGYLHFQKERGADLTVTVVEKYANEILGRGVDRRAVAQMFGTKGRTAANKSDHWPGQFEKGLAAAQKQNEILVGRMEAIRVPLMKEADKKYNDFFRGRRH
ncbi:hypothetical protein [Ruegeria arenilitoris]|uniref:hypothetical protein n=1 Tax=Ruegeria arenilitoris TaxID=1173585 RepID=UPI00147D6E83|nr:hypothetical protein [Ruegeria arenilitoris]